MIKQLTIRNFQSHRFSKLEFCPGVNVIVGESDQGKTAIIRALKWVLFNRPGGDSFRSRNVNGETKITLETENETIERGRSKNTNYYSCENKQLFYEKFGTELPDEIKSVYPVIDWINFQFQFDSPFLLTLSGGEAAKLLNRVLKLDDIDAAIKNINQLDREKNAELKEVEKQLAKTNEEIKSLGWVEKAEGEIEALKGLENEIKIKINEKNTIISLIEKNDYLKREIETKRKEFPPNEEIIFLENKLAELIELTQQDKELEEIIKNITSIQKQIKETEFDLDLLEKDLKDILPKICPTCGQAVKEWEI